jgi:hypothetical protein
MKIHIFYLHYEITGTDGKYRPYWFNYEKCFTNLLSTIEGKNVELHVVMDGKVENNWIKKYKDKYITHEIKGEGVPGFKMLQIIKSLLDDKTNDIDLIYQLENDYLHTVGWVEKIVDLFSTYNNLNYVSLYDHNDKYFLHMYEDLVSKIYATDTHHWRTTPSTCGSFVMSKKSFEEDYDILSTMEGDHHKFLWLNEHRSRFILTPIPGLSTHCMDGLLSPTIDWKQINN